VKSGVITVQSSTPEVKQVSNLPSAAVDVAVQRTYIRNGAGRRYWIREQCAEGKIVEIGEEIGPIATEVKIAFPMSHNVLTRIEA